MKNKHSENNNKFEIYNELLENLDYLKKKPEYKYAGAFNINGDVVYIKSIKYQNPATIVFWSDNTKTVSKCMEGDKYDEETGLVFCVLKKLIGASKLHDLLDNWVLQQQTLFDSYEITLADVRKHSKF